jgi:hypothetical protein
MRPRAPERTRTFIASIARWRWPAVRSQLSPVLEAQQFFEEKRLPSARSKIRARFLGQDLEQTLINDPLSLRVSGESREPKVFCAGC